MLVAQLHSFNHVISLLLLLLLSLSLSLSLCDQTLQLDVKREAAISTRTLRLQEEATRHTQEQLQMREAAFEGLKEHYEEHYERKLKEEIATYVFFPCKTQCLSCRCILDCWIVATAGLQYTRARTCGT